MSAIFRILMVQTGAFSVIEQPSYYHMTTETIKTDILELRRSCFYQNQSITLSI
jgi:hypothetical protein